MTENEAAKDQIELILQRDGPQISSDEWDFKSRCIAAGSGLV